jgi:hypothetical protein
MAGRNRRRIRGGRGKRLLRQRGELLKRPCAHLYETGGLRRAHTRGHENVLKRLFVHAGAFNLGLWMRTLFGIGTPRSLQGRAVALGAIITALSVLIGDAIRQSRRNVAITRDWTIDYSDSWWLSPSHENRDLYHGLLGGVRTFDMLRA